MSQEWTIYAPMDVAYTPEEIAQIARAAQAFHAVVKEIGGDMSVHMVKIRGLDILDASVAVTWPQPVQLT